MLDYLWYDSEHYSGPSESANLFWVAVNFEWPNVSCEGSISFSERQHVPLFCDPFIFSYSNIPHTSAQWVNTVNMFNVDFSSPTIWDNNRHFRFRSVPNLLVSISVDLNIAISRIVTSYALRNIETEKCFHYQFLPNFLHFMNRKYGKVQVCFFFVLERCFNSA